MKVEQRYHSFAEVADMLGVTRKTILRWGHEGRFPVTRISQKRWRIHPDMVRKLLRDKEFQS